MNTEQFVIQLIVQCGAVGLCALLIHSFGRKLDALTGALYKAIQRIDLVLDELYRHDKHDNTDSRRRDR